MELVFYLAGASYGRSLSLGALAYRVCPSLRSDSRAAQLGSLKTVVHAGGSFCLY